MGNIIQLYKKTYKVDVHLMNAVNQQNFRNILFGGKMLELWEYSYCNF